MPDEPDTQKNLPGRHRPRLSELSKETTEEDLWDLEDDSRLSPAQPTKRAEPASVIRKAKLDPLEKREPSAENPSKPAVVTHHTKQSSSSPAASKESEGRPGPPKASRPNGLRPRDPKSSTPQLEATVEEPSPEEKQEAPETSVPTSEEPPEKPEKPETKAAPTSGKKETGKGEKLGLIAFGIVFLLLAIWWLVGLFSSISTTRLGDDQPDFPAKGAYVTIEAAETYWREPVRDGISPDVARRDVEFIPVLSVAINDSEAGVLRAIFRNEEGDFVGDSISKKFANGVFDQHAQSTIEFPATDGFMNSGEFNGYRVGDDRWTVELFEGPSADASGSEFKLLFTTPISPSRQ